MPAQPTPPAIKLEMLYTNIGRGHPFYLDGILEALIRSGQIRLIRRETDVFTVSRGLSRRAWQFARWLYRSGSSGGMSGQLYRFFRRGADYNRPGLGLRLMGRDIKRRYAHSADPVLVAHPTLVGILAGRENLLYQHGELVAPEESIVNGAATVFVPTEEVALRFVSSGYARERVVVTGLCIEPALVRQAADSYRARGERLVGDGPLTGAWFSSGAEPKQHLAAIIPAARSVLNKGHRAIIFAQAGGQLAWLVERQLASGFGLQISSASNPVTDESSSLTLVLHENRREENGLVARFFPQFDYFVAPSHERSNWAMGLGLPMFILTPTIGPFAPLNRDLLVAAGVGREAPADEPARLGDMVSDFAHDGTLAAMAEAGWGSESVDGFQAIADYLLDHFSAE